MANELIVEDTRFSVALEGDLRNAGWYPGRHVEDFVDKCKGDFEAYDNWPMLPEAERVLTEYGGLAVAPTAPGEDYSPERFIIDPRGAIGERDRFSLYEKEIGRKLFPLGEIESAMAFIAIDEVGAVYHLMTFIFLQANSFEEAMELWIRGRRSPVTDNPV